MPGNVHDKVFQRKARIAAGDHLFARLENGFKRVGDLPVGKEPRVFPDLVGAEGMHGKEAVPSRRALLRFKQRVEEIGIRIAGNPEALRLAFCRKQALEFGVRRADNNPESW